MAPKASDKSLTELAKGYFRSRALSAAARLGVADALGDEERSVEQLATACRAHPASLYRLLRALASFGVVSETRPSCFVLAPFGQPLRKNHPRSEWSAVVFFGDLLADSWTYLTECVRTGENSAKARPAGVPSRWSQATDAPAIFRAVMGSGAAQDYWPIARAWDFSAYQTIADLGGGGGALIAAVLDTYPRVRGMLVDRRESIAKASARFDRGEFGDRCRLLAADLLEGVPAGADVYVMKHLLHGYDDPAAIQILDHCRTVLPPEGRLLVIEFILPDMVDRPDEQLEYRLMSDLNMMAVTGGKERSALEWKSLLAKAGFECLRIIPVPEDLVSIIEAVNAYPS
jgi:ubiquinone/menaquinone biosynthesis C-methylase UbiE